jgi:hypothetical protein
MTKITEMPAVARGFISNLDLSVVDEPDWTIPSPPQERRVSIVTTAAAWAPVNRQINSSECL